MKTYNAMLIGSDIDTPANLCIDWYDSYKNSFRRYGDILAGVDTSYNLQAITRNSKSREILIGGRDILNSIKQGIRTNLWSASGLATGDEIKSIKSGKDVTVTQEYMLIGGGNVSEDACFLLSYDGTSFVDLTSGLTGWTDGFITAIGNNMVGGFWVIAGYKKDGTPQLWTYDGTSFTDDSADVSGYGIITDIANYDGYWVYILVTDAGEVLVYDGDDITDLTADAGTIGIQLYRVYYSARMNKVYIGGDEIFLEFVYPDVFTDLSAQLAIPPDNGINTIIDLDNEIMIGEVEYAGGVPTGGASTIQTWDGIVSKNISASLKELKTDPVLNGISWEGAM